MSFVHLQNTKKLTHSIVFHALFMSIAFLLFGCGPDLVGTGPQITKELNITNIDTIVIHDSLNVHISHSEEFKSSVSGDANLLDYFRHEQDKTTLNLRLKHNAKILRGELTFFIALPKLHTLKVVDGSKVDIKKLDTRSDIRLDFSGMSDIKMNVDTDGLVDIKVAGSSLVQGQVRAKATRWKLTGNSRSLARIQADQTDLDASGGSWVEFVGECNVFVFELAGGSKGFFEKFLLQKIDAHLSGDSKGLIKHDGVLSALIEGNSRLFCTGNPTIEKLETSGGGQLDPTQTAPSKE